ncbi:MAG: GDSL-type esterase/lipase family protein [Candidatus Microsaccharimonas sp.]
MPRLPQPGADAGQWGSILNEYLSVSLDEDGALKTDSVSAAQLKPGAVTNTAIATGIIAEDKLSSAVQTKLNATTVPPVTSVAGKTGDVSVVKADVGLSNVDNTSDENKPVSTATQTALDNKATLSHTHTADQITETTNNKVLTASERTKLSSLATVANTGSYTDLTNKPTIPTVPVTSVASKTGDINLVKGDVGLGNVDNTSDIDKPISSATQTALNRVSVGVRLRVAATSARTSSTFERPVYADVPAWAASFTYALGQVVKSGAITYICITAGTSGTVAPAATNGTIADGTIQWTVWGWSPSVVADGPIYTGTQTNPSLPNVYYPALDSGCFALYGASASVYLTNYWKLDRFQQSAGSTVSGDASVSFTTDAPKFAVLGGLGAVLRIRIDGRLYSLDQLKPFSTGGTVFHVFDFTSTGGRRPRTVQVDLHRFTPYFYGVAVDAKSSVWKPSAKAIRAVWISDSTWAGSTYGPSAWTVPHIAGDLLGWADNWNFSTGGTGHLNPGTGPFYTFRQRIPQALALNPDVWMIFGSLNDIPYGTTAQVTAAVQGCISDIRAGGSDAPIIIGGIWPRVDDTNMVAYENAIQAGVSAASDSRTWFIPVRTDPAGPWVMGPNNNNSHPSTNQAQQLIAAGSDNTHPLEIGTLYFAHRINRSVRELVLPYVI